MLPRPAHLTPDNAARFKDQSVVNIYPLRLPYPPQVFDILVDLITDEPRAVLDVGAGTGDIARGLVRRVERIDAVDFSPAMIAKGRTLPGGDHPHLRWIYGAVETVALDPPYALITAGDSAHWMDWEVVFPRFGDVLTRGGVVAIVHRVKLPAPWQDGLEALIRQLSTMQNYQPFDLIDELEKRHLFHRLGERETTPITSTQSIDDYIASFHSRSSLSLDRMPAADAAAFDRQLRDLVSPWSKEGILELQTDGCIVWGKPKGHR
jgi:ubiquinone/menaquinone biosynthesis C-methylase UbiE